MTQATTKDYWISPSALHIELNALGEPDYIQASCVSGAQILVYVKDVIDYDAGHNYRRWPLQASPTIFNSHTEKYVYVAIPCNDKVGTFAKIVFPSELIDIYGKNENEEQIGLVDYYYINIQGVITSSGDNGTELRNWKINNRINTGYLSSDEAISAYQNETEWYNYSSVDGIVTFLKNLTMKMGVVFRQLYVDRLKVVTDGELFFDGDKGKITGVTSDDTNLADEDKIVTPRFLDYSSISKKHDDIVDVFITFLKGIIIGDNGNISSSTFSSGALGTGFRLGSYGDTTDSYLEVDRLLVRKVAEFIELVIRELRHVGGEIVLTPAAMKCVRVEAMDESNSITTDPQPHHWRCYFTAEQDGKSISNDFEVGDFVRCQTFNVKAGVNDNAKNKYYWRKVSGVGDDYIDVLYADCDTNSDAPAAGDEMVMLGSAVAGRQAAIVLASYGSDAPSIKCYRGIDSYSLVGKEVFVVSKEMVDIIADRLRYRTDNGVVDVADKFTSIEADADGLKTQVAQHGKTIDGHTTQLGTLGNELTEQGEQIKGMDSKIEQTATQISLSVGLTLSERKNMLVGSAFRKQGEGCRYNGATITRTMGYDSTNALRCMGKGFIGARWLGGTDGYSNVRLEKGKTYTLSFLARAASAGVSVVAEVIWQGTAKDASRPAGYAGPVGSGAVISESVANDGQWHVYQKTFKVPANAAYEWVEVFVFANNDTDRTVYIARPMLAESIFVEKDKVDDSKYTGWSLSAEDYGYIGGNMLDNCRRLTIGGNLTAVGSIDDTTAYDLRCATIHAKSTTTQMAVVAQWQVGSSIVGGKDYILQFMAKGKGLIKAYMYGGSNISIYAESSGESMKKDATADGYRFIELTDSWTPCWVHWRSVGSGTPQNVLLRVEDGAEAWVTMPKMEAGAKPTDWTDTNTDYSENASVASKLLRSGLDIENGKITATANSFEVRNNAGEQTASVNENGVFETNEAVLRGSLYADNGYFAGQIRHAQVTVDENNFRDYFQKVDKSIRDNAYTPKFENLGSNAFIESIPGNILKKDEEGEVFDFYMWLPNIFPTTNPYNDKRYEWARESVGNTISIRLASSCDIAMTIYGVATADSDGSNVRESSATIEAGETAYLTCRVGRSGYLNESGSLVTGVEIVYWEAIVGKTIDKANAHNLINL